MSLLELARIRRLLEEILGRRVDLTTRDSLILALRERILSEAAEKGLIPPVDVVFAD